MVAAACLWVSAACDATSEALPVADAHVDESESAAPVALDAGRDLEAGRELDAREVVLAPLVDMEDWRSYDAALDPLRDHQPSVVSCDARSFYEELGALEVDTARCNYLLAVAPALRRVPAGSEVHLSLLHFDPFPSGRASRSPSSARSGRWTSRTRYVCTSTITVATRTCSTRSR